MFWKGVILSVIKGEMKGNGVWVLIIKVCVFVFVKSENFFNFW